MFPFTPSSEPISTIVDVLKYRALGQEAVEAYRLLATGDGDDRTLSFGQLDHLARQIATQLLAEHAQPGDRILLLFPSGLEFLSAFFGCLYSGLAAVPAYAPHAGKRDRTLPRLRAIASNARPAVILTTRELLPTVKSLQEDVPEFRGVKVLGFEEIAAESASSLELPTVRPDDLAFLQYTSGSTGDPKGVMISHANLLHNEEVIRAAFGHNEPTNVVGWLPFFHDMGLIGNLLHPLYLGSTAILMPPAAFLQRPVRWLDAISRFRAATSGGPNFAYELCVERIRDEDLDGIDLSSWQLAFNGAEPVHAETMRRFSEKFACCGFRAEAFYPCYGLAESTLLVTGAERSVGPKFLHVDPEALAAHRAVAVTSSAKVSDGEKTVELVSSGKVWNDLSVRIVDPETTRSLVDGRVGEIWVHGQSVSAGYWERPDINRSQFAATIESEAGVTYLRTGDLGFLHEGQLYVTGRIKDLIIIRGSNHYPQDIEQTVVQSHSAFSAGMATAFSVDVSGEEKLVVLAEPDRSFRKTSSAQLNEIIECVRRAVASQHGLEPHAVLLLRVGGIPKTSSGKIQRQLARRQYLANELDALNSWTKSSSTTFDSNVAADRETPLPPQLDSPVDTGEIRSWLQRRLSGKLQVPPSAIAADVPFAEFALDSKEAVIISGELAEWLGRPLSATLLYEFTTIAELASHLGSKNVLADSRTPASSNATFASTAGETNTRAQAVAIIGIGCRVPGARGPEEFWTLLQNGVDAIREIPPERWCAADYYDPDPNVPGKMNTRWGGFLDGIDQFDPVFFGIAPREAVRMDPQQRLLLEIVWESLADAGIPPEALSGTRTGVFIGISSDDYGRMQIDHPGLSDQHAGTGSALSIAANRISYLLNLRGRSLAVDTACSSSLLAVDLACRSLQDGESDVAIAGGVNLILSPHVTVNFSKAGFMSPDGRCQAFDANANGYVRSEGAGVVILKPLARALADGDPIYAVIRGSAVNQDGRSNGLTAPNPQSQQDVLRTAYRSAGVRPAEIQYVEAHGTGTFLGDPIEASALSAVLVEGRDLNDRCRIGSVKTNIGHLEAAAGVVGLIKTALALKHRRLPPSLHFRKPNPHIPFDNLPIQVQVSEEPWKVSHGRTRLAGVSAFGFGGTNVHIVLEEAPESSSPPNVSEKNERRQLFTLSAHTAEALRSLAASTVRALEAAPEDSLADIVATVNRHRGQLAHRLAVVVSSTEELRRALNDWKSDPEAGGVVAGRVVPSDVPRFVFVCGGQGPQRLRMGLSLFEQEPVFRETFAECDRLIADIAGWSLLEELHRPQQDDRLDQTEFAQPALFALQVSLAALWQSWGVVPEAIVGHSLGEVAAAHLAGILALDEAIRLIVVRGQLMQQTAGRGRMLAVDMSHHEAVQLVEQHSGKLVIAAENGPRSLVLSGDAPLVTDLAAQLKQRGVFCRLLRGLVAFHSHHIDRAQRELVERFSGVAHRPPKIPFYSTVTGKQISDSELSAAYWGRNAREPVLFGKSVETMLADGLNCFVELSPHPTLTASIIAAGSTKPILAFPSLRRDQDERATLLRTLGTLWTTGVPVSRASVTERTGKILSLPAFAWQRERYWLDEDEIVRGPVQGDTLTVGSGERHEPDLHRWFYRLIWERVEGTDPALRHDLRRRTNGSLHASPWWVVGSKEHPEGETFARQLEQAGESVIRVDSDVAFAKRGDRHYALNPLVADHWKQLAVEASPQSGSCCRGILLLGGLKESTVSNSEQCWNALIDSGVGLVTSCVQAVAEVVWTEKPRIWLVTRGAQDIATEDAASDCTVSVEQAPLWGLGRVIAWEHPDLWGGLIDLDPAASLDENAALLLQDVCAESAELQIAYRKNTRYVARLDRTKTGTPKLVRLRKEGSYLITGGLGDLGLQLARWLVDHGARRLILLGRTPLPPRREWKGLDENSRLASQVRVIRELESLGASVVTATVDVTNAVALRTFLDDYAAEGWPAIRGVIHAAMVLENRTLANVDLSHLREIMLPKIVGAWTLHEAFATGDLDFFVMFSSAAALLGSPGQAGYCAANAFLDQLAAFRRSKGLSGTSIQWGPWAATGWAARREKINHLALRGIRSFSTNSGLAAFGHLLRRDVAEIGVLQVDWQQFARFHPLAAQLPLFSRLKDEFEIAAEPAHTLRPLSEISQLATEERQELFNEHLKRHASRLLGMSLDRLPIDLPLNSLGFDSLMALELKNWILSACQIDFPISEFLTGASVDTLSASLTRLSFETGSKSLFSHPAKGEDTNPGSDATGIPLSLSQQRMWLLDQMDPRNPVWNTPAAVRLSGPLDVQAFSESWREILRRHEILRCRFPTVDGRATQRVTQDEVPVHIVDLCELAEEVREQEASRLVREAMETPFDLADETLARAMLIRLRPDEHLVVVNIHHIVTDGLSMGLLMRELGALYTAFSRGEPSPLPPLSANYSDYTRWQQEWLAGKEFFSRLEYWKTKLLDAPKLEFPTDHRRPATQVFVGRVEYLELSPELHQQLRERSQQAGCTPFVTLLAAFKMLLGRYASQSDIVVGTFFASRPRSEFESLIGLFVENVVLRTSLDGNPTFVELQQRVRQTIQEAFANSDVPFEKLLETLKVRRDASHSPIFQVAFSSGPVPELDLPGLDAQFVPMERQRTNLDFSLWINDAVDGLNLSLEYNTTLFTQETMRGLLQSYRTLLEEIARDSDVSLSKLNLLDGDATAELRRLGSSAATRKKPDLPELVHTRFEHQVRLRPQDLAVECEGNSLTYAELNSRSNQLARRLQEAGAGPDQLIGICLPRSLDLAVAVLAVLKSGAAYVPLDPESPQERLAGMLADVELTIVVTIEQFDQLISGEGPRICVDRDQAQIAIFSSENIASPVGPQNRLYAIFTSGSTGRPKLAAVQHVNFINLLDWFCEDFAFGPSDRTLMVTSFNFDLTQKNLFAPLLTGGRLHLLPSGVYDPELIAELIEQHEITRLNATPSAFYPLVEGELADWKRLQSLRTLFLGGEPISVRRLANWLDSPESQAELVNTYGPTECTDICAFYRLDETAEFLDESLPIGRPIPGAELFVIDAQFRLLPRGALGELGIAGAGVGEGYLNDHGMTADRFIPHPDPRFPGERLYRTGDLVRWRSDGHLEFVGRTDHQVKIRGHRIELGEIETAFSSHSAIQEAVVLARPDELCINRLVAYIVFRDEPCTVADLRAHLKPLLPDYMLPAAWVFLDAFPLTPNGKLDRKSLPEPIEDATTKTEGNGAGTATEEILAGIWCRVLRKEQIRINDNFFELGGDSILAVQMISLARQQGLRITPVQIFEHQTIAELARVAVADTAGTAELGPATGPAELLPFQQWFLEQNWKEPEHWNMALLLATPADVDIDALRRAMQEVLCQHDALRTQFFHTAEGWRSEIPEPGVRQQEELVALHDLSTVPVETQMTAIEDIANRMHTCQRLAEGRLSQAAWIRLGDGQDGRLLWIVHHLVIDGVSWRIVLDDLQTAYEQAREGRELSLPSKSTPFAAVAAQFATFAQSDLARSTRPVWERISTFEPPRLPVDFADGEDIHSKNTEGSVDVLSVRLTATETRQLLEQVHGAYRTQMNDLLLCALAEVLAMWTGGDQILVEVEGHGREEIVAGVDLSRTVGCFTSLLPVVLDGGANGRDPGSHIKTVKQQLREIPDRGITYGLLRYLGGDPQLRQQFETSPQAEISFNYLGQFDQHQSGSLVKALLHESVGAIRSPDGTRRQLLEVLGQVINGELRFDWRYSTHLHRRETIARRAEQYLSAIRRLIDHCLQPGQEGVVPADFPLANLTQPVLDRLVHQIRERTGKPFRDAVEQIHGVSPMQHGMLYHSLLAPESEVYFLQFRFELEGEMDLEAVEQVWNRLLSRHGVLRSAIEWHGLDEPVQMIYRTVPFPIHYEDWSDRPGARVPSELEAWLEQDRIRGFDLSQPGSHRVAIISLKERRHHFIWSIHHALVDAWSVGLVLQEFLTLYNAKNSKQEVTLDSAPGFSRFINWLQSRQRGQANKFVTQLLGDFRRPNRLSIDRGHSQSATQMFDLVRLELTEAETHELQEFAQSNHITVSTVLLGLWGVLIGSLSEDDDVVFGTVLAGRSPEIEHVESIVGMLINTVPVRVRLGGALMFVEWLRELQSQQTRLREFEYYSLSEFQNCSGVPVGSPLFDSLFSYENQPMGPLLWSDQNLLILRDIAFTDWNSIPLSVAAIPGKTLVIDFKSQRDRFAKGDIAILVRSFHEMCKQVLQFTHFTLVEVQGVLREVRDSSRAVQMRDLSNKSQKKLQSIKRKGRTSAPEAN